MAYNWLPALGMVRRLLREALWAPTLIVLAALVLAHLPRALDWWWLLHVAGGAAVAYCYLRAIAIARPRLGSLRPAVAYLLAFALACTTALQEGNYDTMTDLILGIVGAAAYLAAQAIRNSRDAS